MYYKDLVASTAGACDFHQSLSSHMNVLCKFCLALQSYDSTHCQECIVCKYAFWNGSVADRMGVKHAMGFSNSSCLYCERVVGSCAFISHPVAAMELITLRNNYFIPNRPSQTIEVIKGELGFSYRPYAVIVYYRITQNIGRCSTDMQVNMWAGLRDSRPGACLIHAT